MKRLICLFLLLACLVFAQTATTTATTVTTPATPTNTATTTTSAAATASAPSSWFVGTGMEFNPYYSSPAFASMPAYLPAVHIGGCWTSFCEISTLEFSPSAATVRQDVGYKMKSAADGSVMLIAIAGGAVTTTTATNTVIPTTITLGSVGGGFAVKVDPGVIPFLKSIKGKGVSVLAEVRIAEVSSAGVAPQASLWIDYRFK
jgi:hypothetical protein